MRSEPVEEIPLRVHLVGIGGAGMSGLALCLIDMNRRVSGSDLRRSTDTEHLILKGAKIFHEHAAENILDAELLVVSEAIPADNVELQAARERGLPILRRAQCLNLLCPEKKSIHVAGSHGKSTTTAMLAKVLEAAALSPSFLLGGTVASLSEQRARVTGGDYFVAEACEAFQSLSHLQPDVAVITNIDDEHVEHYGSQSELDSAFRHFAVRVGPGGTLIANGDDAGVRRISTQLQVPVMTFGFGAHNDVQAVSVELGKLGSRFQIRCGDRILGAIALPIPGKHAVANALACIAASHTLGVAFDDIANGLGTFTGVSRRWQRHGLINGLQVVDDYAHHPTELASSIETARLVRDEGQRLVVAFQPQLYSRTGRLYREFAQVLTRADLVLLLEVDAGGERDNGAVRSKLILTELIRAGVAVEYFEDVDDLVDRAAGHLQKGDFLLVVGAGNIATAAVRLTRRWASESAAIFEAAALSAERPAINASGSTAQPESVIAAFQVHARNAAQRCAVAHGTNKLAYEQLDALSHRVAAGLRVRGVGQGSVVGANLPPSIELIALMLATMRMGAIYLPLDESIPSERIRFMYETARGDVLVTLPGSKIDIDTFSADRIYMRDLQNKSVTSPDPGLDGLDGRVDGQLTAYICFTSGSMGQPKGVAISHGALLALVRDIAPRFEINAQTKMAVNTSISFDVSIAEFWTTLYGGGQLCISGSRRPLLGARLADFLEHDEITHAAITPTVLTTMPFRALQSLRCIVCAGEACPQSLVDIWAGGRTFFNAYGPTEATIYATVAQCHPGEQVTIGQALSHLHTYVFDQTLAPVAAGDIGELCLGGDGVARGYIGLNHENDEKFRTIQLGQAAGTRIYRTGDVVKLNPDGNLSFLGRLDEQVKIRGNRVELEEVERALKQVAGIEDAAVCVDKRPNVDELVCFMIVNARYILNDGQLKERLSTWLPEYMIPQHLVQIEAMPVTPSGKKNRQALLSKYKNKIVRQTTWVAPRNAEEKMVASIWKYVLRIDRNIGVYDDFASLGGDSLTSLLVIMELERHLGAQIPPGYFGRFTTVTRMAVQMADLLYDSSQPEDTGSAGTFLSPRVYKQLRDLTAGWVGTRTSDAGLIISADAENPVHHFFCCMQNDIEFVALSRYLGKEFQVHGMRSGHLVMDYTPANIERLASHYIAEIGQISPDGPLLIAGICQGGIIAHAIANKLRLAGREIPLLILMEQSWLVPYAGNIQYIFGEDSYLNPVARNYSGLEIYQQTYGDRCKVDIVPGVHGAMLFEPNVHHFVSKLRLALASLVQHSSENLAASEHAR